MADPYRPPPPVPASNVIQPPPLPPRIPTGQPTAYCGDMRGDLYNNSSYGGGYSGYNPYNTMYGSSMNPYGSYGTSGYSYSGHPMRGGESDFVRIAEERGRGAMQSVETIVTAFGSISMMLESTLNAFYSSFRAILGVADQFTRLRSQFRGIIETFAAFKLLKWLLNRLMVLLRLRSLAEANADMAWSLASNEGGGSSPTNWASLAITGIALAGPWLIYRLIRVLVLNAQESTKWAKGEAEFYDARALYEFVPQSNNELPLKPQEIIRIAPKESQPNVRGWVLAADLSGERIGLVPNNYIQVTGRRNISSERRFDAAFNDVTSGRADSLGRLSD